MILDKIVAHKKIEVEERKTKVPLAQLEKQLNSNTKGFYRKLEEGDDIKLIAEIKKASPSRGIIRENFKPVELARICEEGGASALSVLTDEEFFKGSLEYLLNISKNVSVPVLRKDFIIDEYQVIEARSYGADAVLLLASILNSKQIESFIKLAKDYNMDCLVEVYTEEELKKVLDASAQMIGINNRDLKTFKVDIENTEKIIKSIPRGKLVVSESGIFTKEDVGYLKSLGVKAVLVGESIMASVDIGSKIKELVGND